ncbi:hypothetical protein SC1_02318 [Sphingopyxis sp. C-1]|nr:hypothetical protein SC1_02318 [Sphingopyxis sp. C-1]
MAPEPFMKPPHPDDERYLGVKDEDLKSVGEKNCAPQH